MRALGSLEVSGVWVWYESDEIVVGGGRASDVVAAACRLQGNLYATSRRQLSQLGKRPADASAQTRQPLKLINTRRRRRQ